MGLHYLLKGGGYLRYYFTWIMGRSSFWKEKELLAGCRLWFATGSSILWTFSDLSVIAGVLVLVFYRINPGLGYTSLAWILHILMDIISHSKNYFPTPFLYPISNFTIDGINSPLFHAVNWIALVVVYFYYFIYKKKICKRETV